ncbi:sulfite exporter TauE/SafE family protein [Facilibium subflavum]|uniref:sulfite exporter TauE/SafE family protein n=1 Tax=Facilibium subflavum TaxID=2219058 RepID=UPI000E64B251|nr:sulfite exporter TauE/SafE family protein [Facilibium subflavum]
MIYLLILLIFAGCFTGFLAGLLGIGGGIIIVPVLAFVFHLVPSTSDSYMQFAAGSSLGIMIFTALPSVAHKLRQREVNLNIVKMFAPWIITASIAGAALARFVNPRVLSILFALLLIAMFAKMVLQKHHELEKPRRNSKRKSAFWGSLIGFKSGIFGIGGGIMSIPYIHSLGYSIRIAIGTSSMFTLIIALTGSISFIITGLTASITTPWTLGYLYLPAIICVAPTSMLCAKIAAKVSTKTPHRLLKIIFLCLLLLSAIKMIWLAI